ncbi:TPA: hypothetical protein ENS27_10690 [bacterium]|nr:hypothetical protein [bacterium]
MFQKYHLTIFTITLLSFAIGCTRDIPNRITDADFPIPPTPKIVSSTLKSNMEISSDYIISMTFNNSMKSVNIAVSGVNGKTILGLNNTSATFEPSSKMSDGSHTLLVTGIDQYGQELSEGPITFYVKSGSSSNGSTTTNAYPSSFIAFSSNRDGDYEIYVMKADGSNVKPLTNNFSQDTQPAWSLDGRFIAFASDRNGLTMWNSDIFIMKSDGSSQINITNTPGINESNPCWSWDGTMICFLTDIDGFLDYYVIDLNKYFMRPMEENETFDFYYPWVYDEKFLTWDDSGKSDIYLNGVTNLTNNFANDVWGSWAPDGKKIVFSTNRDSNYEIYIMNFDGSKPTRLTNNIYDDIQPFWSPF